eukprot:6203237-Pleurochrysis_carterae.AAC.2
MPLPRWEPATDTRSTTGHFVGRRAYARCRAITHNIPLRPLRQKLHTNLAPFVVKSVSLAHRPRSALANTSTAALLRSRLPARRPHLLERSSHLKAAFFKPPCTITCDCASRSAAADVVFATHADADVDAADADANADDEDDIAA